MIYNTMDGEAKSVVMIFFALVAGDRRPFRFPMPPWADFRRDEVGRN